MTAIEVIEREALGKKVKELRRQGNLPGVVYGPKRKEALAITINARVFTDLWKKAGETTMIDLKVGENKAQKVLIHSVDLDPVKHVPVHVDFYELDTTKPITLNVPLRYEGDAPAERVLGGVLLSQLHEVEISALPENLPHDLEVDLSKLETFDDRLTIGDLNLPEGVEVTGDEKLLIAFVEAPRTQAQLDEEDEKEAAGGDIDFDKIGDAETKGKADDDESSSDEETKSEE